jgi:hypothetical protein
MSIPYPVQRVADGPRFNLGGPKALNDIGCFEVPKDLPIQCGEGVIDTTYLSELIGRAKPSLWGWPMLDSLSPRCIHRSDWIRASALGLLVTKTGASTGTTTGVWVGVTDDMPVNQRWVTGRTYGVVRWLSTGTPFASGGDSGSLVKLYMDGKIVPLGIHLGSVENLSLFTFEGDVCRALESVLHVDLFFCSQNRIVCS